MAKHEDFETFPDITPSSITESMSFEIEADEIKTEQDFQNLIHKMFRYQECDFYLFQEKKGPRNQLILNGESLNWIRFEETEFFYYKDPSGEGYVRVERQDGHYQWDWEEEIVEKGPMFMRSRLRLSDSKARELESWQKIQMEEAYRKRLIEIQNSFTVFLSYDARDQNEANQIYEAIVAAGGKAFLAEKSLKPGDDFAETIKNALRTSRELWLLVSPNSLKSDWVVSEWGAAWALDKKIVPILHRCGPESLPDRIRRLHCIDFYRYRDLVQDTFPPSPA